MKILGKDFSNSSKREIALIGIPTLLVIVLAFWLAYQFVRPAPPTTLTMSTGSAEGAYHAFGLRYQKALAKAGITLTLKTSAGSVENLARLRGETIEMIDVAFVQGGVRPQAPNGDAAEKPNGANAEEESSVVSLASLYHEPLWVFYRTVSGKPNLDSLAQLAKKRVNIGPSGSGTRALALDLLAANSVDAGAATLTDLKNTDAAAALKAGEIDAAFLVVSPSSALVRELLRTPDIRLMSFAQSDAYTRRFPYLDAVTLYKGVVDLGTNVPAQDVTLLAPTANLVAREDLHPALLYLLMEVATEVHRDGGAFHKPGVFPSMANVDFPLAEESRRYFKNGRPFFQRSLPFWLANLVERMMVMLVPVIAVLIPLFKVLPWLWTWRMRSRIYRWYGELKFLERDLTAKQTSPASEQARDALAKHLTRLDEIEAQAQLLPLPAAFMDRVYTLRQHVHYVREKLLALPVASNGTHPR